MSAVVKWLSVHKPKLNLTRWVTLVVKAEILRGLVVPTFDRVQWTFTDSVKKVEVILLEKQVDRTAPSIFI